MNTGGAGVEIRLSDLWGDICVSKDLLLPLWPQLRLTLTIVKP